MSKVSLRRRRARVRLFGTVARPRVSVYRSLRTVRVQLIDDARGHTLATAQTQGEDTPTAAARTAGRELGQQAFKLGVKAVVFDRGGRRYHGRVKAVAEGLREAGIAV